MKQNNELRLTLLGKPIIALNNIPLQFTRRRTLALLAYLALTGRPHLRSALAARLTGDDASEQQARQHLNNALRDLTLLRPFLSLDAQQVWLPEAPRVELDVQAFIGAVERGRSQNDMEALEAAVELYRGELLEGFVLRDAPHFEEWLLVEQQRLHHLLLEALELLANLALAQNRPAQGIAAARRLLALEPWREQTHRTL
nr:bacterial transcriptional activator domain-containing protein [Chloroflexaceae bacterium]